MSGLFRLTALIVAAFVCLPGSSDARTRFNCVIPRDQPAADEQFHFALNTYFDATQGLVNAIQAWHGGEIQNANEYLDQAKTGMVNVKMILENIPDELLSEDLVVREGANENVLQELGRYGYTVPQTSLEAVRILEQDADRAVEELGEQEFVGESGDHQLITNLGNIVQRAMDVTSGIGALFASSHLD